MQSLRAQVAFSSVLSTTMGAATFALVVYSVLAADLLAEFDIERWQVGLMVTATTITGGLVSPAVGAVTDRVGARRATVATLVGSGVALLAIALSPTYLVLITAAVISGVFQAVANPSTNKLISEHISLGNRGVITGIKQSGVQAGTFIGGLTLPGLALALGWRGAVSAYGVLAILAGVVAVASLPADVRAPAARRSEGGTLPPIIFRLGAYGFLLGAGGTAMFTYLPLFAQESLGMSVQAAGAAAALVGLTGIVARIAWGRIAEVRLGADRSLRVMALGAIGAAAMLVAAPAVPWLIWPAAIATGSSASAWNAVGMLAIIESVPSSRAGTGSGVVLLGFLLGLGLGAPAFGWSVDALASYRPGWAAISVLFLGGWLTLRRP